MAVGPAAPHVEENSFTDLTRLLNRLERNLFSPEAEQTFRKSSYARSKIGANVEYARTLLFRLEHAYATTPSSTERTARQKDLSQKRLAVKRLQDRLYELNEMDDENVDGFSSDSDSEDLLRRYGPAIADADSGINSKPNMLLDDSDANRTVADGNKGFESNLRSRRDAADNSKSLAATTGIDTISQPQRPTPGSSTDAFAPKPSTSANETLLAHHTSEQESLTSSLLSLATALKTSTLSFSDELSASNPTVDRATSSLDRNVSGMEAAEKRMGMLRRMTEGKGWWARISLYAWVGVLWVAVILIMFVMPKLRF